VECVCVLAIYRLLRDLTFGPREIARMTSAYEIALVELAIDNKADDRTEVIALAIIHRARAGEESVRGLVDFAIRQITQATAKNSPEESTVPDSIPKVPARKKSD
jgi:hypothetical protein